MFLDYLNRRVFSETFNVVLLYWKRFGSYCPSLSPQSTRCYSRKRLSAFVWDVGVANGQNYGTKGLIRKTVENVTVLFIVNSSKCWLFCSEDIVKLFLRTFCWPETASANINYMRMNMIGMGLNMINCFLVCIEFNGSFENPPPLCLVPSASKSYQNEENTWTSFFVYNNFFLKF